MWRTRRPVCGNQCVLISVCMAICCPDWDVTSLQQRRGGRERTQGGRMRIHNLIRLLTTIQQPTWKGLEIHWVDYYTDHSFEMSSLCSFCTYTGYFAVNEPDQTDGSLGAGEMSSGPQSGNIYADTSMANWSLTSTRQSSHPNKQMLSQQRYRSYSPIAACSSFLCTLRPKTASPIRNTCSSGSRSPSGLPSRPSDVSATPELLTPPGFHLG